MANRQELRMIGALAELREPCDAIIARTVAVGDEGEKLLQELEALGQPTLEGRTMAIVAAVGGLREDVQRLRAAIGKALDALVQPDVAGDAA